MPSGRQRGSRVIYVAGSVREFPEEVQSWLGRAENPAGASPNIYDALALLAAGARPVAIIVSAEAVDWNELEVFDHLSQVQRTLRVYVVGQDYHEAKCEAACRRGARPFDGAAMAELSDLSRDRPVAEGPAGLLAGSVRSTRYPPEPAMPEPTLAGSGADEPAADGPPVRLVAEEAELEEQAPIPFPWSPSADRPQRTPPVKTRESSAPAPESSANRRTPPGGPVELDPEEVKALMGKPGDAGASLPEESSS